MIIAHSPAIGPVKLDVVISEKHTSSIDITGNPIETGAEVNDHAYIKPKEVTLEIASSNASATYEALIRFQESRVPFYLTTGLKIYKNMLVQSINATRDKTNSRILFGTIDLKEVIIVSTGSATGGKSPSGSPGGNKSTSARNPTAQSANNTATADRAANSVQTGDNPTSTVPEAKSQSLLSRLTQ